jgi:phosphoribosylanthranilate isomerase
MKTYVPRIKICCIQNEQEAATAIRLGASALGLVSQMPSGLGVISEARIARIVQEIPPGVSAFLLTSRSDVASIVSQQRRTRVDTIQLVDELPQGVHEELRRALPGVRIVQVVHVTGDESVEQAVSIAPSVDALLLDSGNPRLGVKELGGTGRTHDWSLSRRIRDEVDRPVYLAGGLNPSNVAEAVRQVEPFGLDVCSGVRTDGLLNEDKLEAFIRQALGPESIQRPVTRYP